ncbi:lipid II:glycine glycyltransferase FemX [Halocatena pleomorpha]|uniref:GNAT family N-acetyltransferase n=1 Tax=Halocatena pleomorpha TaxID=1785090 RepID=A0A3P3RB78_9EURY|nr:GNAT family N-acetyltransferase [Halocatena pleomorpha]RRJ30731.1 GNAT family N-acetyltransferase [Halocatena pleomorpha]
MTIEIDVFEDDRADEWNRYVDQSPIATPFHRYGVLDLLATEVGAQVHTLVGFKGQEPIGVLPVFEQTKGPFRLVVSPPELEVFTLGPAFLNIEKLKQRKRERRQKRFVESCLDWISTEVDPDYIDIRTVVQYDDSRPFIWRGYDVSPSYTYVLDLSPDKEEILMGFSRDARSTIRDGDAVTGDAPVIGQAGTAGIEPIIERIRTRHTEQGESYSLTPRFVQQLYDQLPDGMMRVYAVRVADDIVGGLITLEHDTTIYRWQGGAKTDGSLPANDILDWRIMCDAKDRNITRYDLVGANNPRLCRYKSKFNPTPKQYHVITRRTRLMQAAVGVRRLLSNRLPHLSSR